MVKEVVQIEKIDTTELAERVARNSDAYLDMENDIAQVAALADGLVAVFESMIPPEDVDLRAIYTLASMIRDRAVDLRANYRVAS